MDIYIPTTKRELSLRKQKVYAEFAEVVNWGRRNPAKFAEVMFGIKLMDYQLLAFNQSWTRPFVAWLWCRGGGKTASVAAYEMTRMVLIPNYRVYICATKAEQATESFTKIEEIALNRIPSFKGVTDVFQYELERHGNNKTGFGHDPKGYRFSLFNGSAMQTLSSNETGFRGKRGGVWYDEAAFIRKELMDVGDKFANVDADFMIDTTGNNYLQPRQMPLQLLYTSSAGSTDMPFYDKYRTFAKHMMTGDPNYYVCNFDVDAIFNNSSLDGKPIKSHLSAAQIEKEINDNPESAEQELYNMFKTGAGKSAVVSEDCLIRNSEPRLPVFYNDTSKRKFVLCFDPARNYDNSILAVWEMVKEKNGYNAYLVNMISMVNTDSAKKTPLNYIEQLEIIKSTMIAYNGAEAPEWENILFYIDAGSGGAGRSGIADQLLLPWTDKMGANHRGIIDPADPQYDSDRRKHPGNAKIVRLIEPKGYKTKMFGALGEMAEQDLLHFPFYDRRSDRIRIKDENGDFREHKLTVAERESLIQMELAKTEVSYIARTETPSTRAVTYELVKERRNKMHDDRAYTIAMGAYALWQMRNKDLRNRKTSNTENILIRARAPVYASMKGA